MKQLTKFPIFFFIASCLCIFNSCGEYLQLNTRLPDRENRVRNSVEFPYKRYITPQLRASQDPKLCLGIAISGGGTRAQAFGFGVLLGLEKISYSDSSNLLKEIDYFSTVSGGSFAAGTYFTELNHFQNQSDKKTFSLNTLYQQGVNERDELVNYFEKVAKSYKVRDIVTTATISRIKRRKRLEQINKYILFTAEPGTYEVLKFNQIFIPSTTDPETAKKVKLPWLLLNTTIYPKFTRMVFLPYSFQSELDVDRIIHIKGYSAVHLSADNDLPISYGIAASSAFPIFTPMFHFSSENYSKDKILNVLDGGVTDNFGILRLKEVVEQDDPKNKKFYLIVDCSGKADYTGLYSNDGLLDRVGNIALATVDGRYYDFYDKDLKNLLDTSLTCVLNLRSVINPRKEVIDSVWKSTDEIIVKALEAPFNFAFGFESLLIPSLKKDGITVPIDADKNLRPDLIGFEEYENISERSKVLLYELVSNIETKLEIRQREEAALILAGKYAVYSNKSKLSSKLRNIQ